MSSVRIGVYVETAAETREYSRPGNLMEFRREHFTTSVRTVIAHGEDQEQDQQFRCRTFGHGVVDRQL